MCVNCARLIQMNEFERFRKRVHEEPALQAELQPIVDPDTFIEAVLELGRTHGCYINRKDVLEALDYGRKRWLERWI